jgi:hypothetical protein
LTGGAFVGEFDPSGQGAFVIGNGNKNQQNINSLQFKSLI